MSASDTNKTSFQNKSNSSREKPWVDKEAIKFPLTINEFRLSFAVLIFSIVLILLEVFIIRTVTNFDDHDIVKFVLVTIIIATLFLITAGYDNDQIAPAMGLLGTMAGYLLGKSNPEPPKSKP